MLNIVSNSSSRVSAVDQMVPGPAALRQAHAGADLRSPVDEDDDDDRVSQIARGAGRRRHPPENHWHRLVIKHKLEQGEPLRMVGMDWKDFLGKEGVFRWRERYGLSGQQSFAQLARLVAGRLTLLVQLGKCTLIFLFCREYLIYYHLLFLILLFPPSPLFFLLS